MSDTVISVENLSKRYLVGHRGGERERYVALRDVIAREARNFTRKALDAFHGRQIVQGDEIEEFWALRDVNFEVRRGEVIGIIGKNGAGKSTLLKILSRITEPTEGRVRLGGRIASLLEVGTGFHPELTGRENVFLNGAILGMTKDEIRKKFDDIVAFAEVEKFLDTPVKHYSSGMYVRLAFAVAAHLKPEILIVDEVLAVGDAEFQKKCLDKMDQASQREGRTVLFVSHNLGVIAALCPTAIWLERGSIRQQGAAQLVISRYLAEGIASKERTVPFNNLRTPPGAANECLCLESLEWLSDIPLQHGQPLKARIRFSTKAPVQDVSVGIGFSGVEGKRLLTYVTDFPDGFRPSLSRPGSYQIDVEVESLPLGPDIYAVDIGFRSGDFHSLAYVAGGTHVDVVAGPNTPAAIVHKGSSVFLPSKWSWNAQPYEIMTTTDGPPNAIIRSHIAQKNR